jgi:hypothetical protein
MNERKELFRTGMTLEARPYLGGEREREEGSPSGLYK